MTMLDLFLWLLSVGLWAVALADTKIGDWITSNPVSRRFLLPVWERIRDGVRWVMRRILRAP